MTATHHTWRSFFSCLDYTAEALKIKENQRFKHIVASILSLYTGEIKKEVVFKLTGIIVCGRENIGSYFSGVILYFAFRRCYAFITVRGSPEMMKGGH